MTIPRSLGAGKTPSDGLKMAEVGVASYLTASGTIPVSYGSSGEIRSKWMQVDRSGCKMMYINGCKWMKVAFAAQKSPRKLRQNHLHRSSVWQFNSEPCQYFDHIRFVKSCRFFEPFVVGFIILVT